MADLGKLTAPRKPITIQGQEWVFSALTLRDNEELLEEMVAKWPKPLSVVKQQLAGLSDSERLELLKLACQYEMRPKYPSSMEFELWKAGPIGGPRAWHRMLLPANSTITLEQAAMLFELARQEDEDARQKAASVNEIPLGNSSAPATGAATAA